jgi:hypothetical protein
MDAITLSRVSALPVLPVLPVLCMRLSQILGEGRDCGLNEAWYGLVHCGIRENVVNGQTRPFPTEYP